MDKKELENILPKLGPLDMDKLPLFSSSQNWHIKDPERFQELIDEIKTLVAPGQYLGDNLFCWSRNLSLFTDDKFRVAWEKNITNIADEAIAWRRYILACAAYHCVQLEGDFVECGAYNGSGVKIVMDYLGGISFPRKFWAYDTFDEHPVPGHQMPENNEKLFERVRNRFFGYDQVSLIKGLIPDSFDVGLPEKITYLHIDLNNAEGEIAALDTLFDRIVSGGIVILDDYEWSGPYRKQKSEEDQWFEVLNYRIIPLPTGQGIVIKR